MELTLLNQSNFILGWLNGKTISLNLSHVPNSSDNFCKIWGSSCITHTLSPFSTGNNSFSKTKFCRDPLQIMINIYLNFHENPKWAIFRKIGTKVKVMWIDLDLVNIRQGHLIIYHWKDNCILYKMIPKYWNLNNLSPSYNQFCTSGSDNNVKFLNLQSALTPLKTVEMCWNLVWISFFCWHPSLPNFIKIGDGSAKKCISWHGITHIPISSADCTIYTLGIEIHCYIVAVSSLCRIQHSLCCSSNQSWQFSFFSFHQVLITAG